MLTNCCCLFSLRGANGCKLRSAEERVKRPREDDSEGSENADPQTEKKARVVEPSEYQKGLEVWKQQMRQRMFIVRLLSCPSWSLSDCSFFEETILTGDVDFNMVLSSCGQDTLFLAVLKKILQPNFIWDTREMLERLCVFIREGKIDVNVECSDGTTPLIVLVNAGFYEGNIFDVTLQHSATVTINKQLADSSSVMSKLVSKSDRDPRIAFNRLRAIHAAGGNLQLLYNGSSLLHRMIDLCATECLILWMEVDFEGFDWQIRDNDNHTMMQKAYHNSLLRSHLTYSGSKERQSVYLLMQEWDNRWSSVTRACVETHLGDDLSYIVTEYLDGTTRKKKKPKDLSGIVCQYLSGTGDAFIGRKEEEEREHELEYLQRVISGSEPAIMPA